MRLTRSPSSDSSIIQRSEEQRDGHRSDVRAHLLAPFHCNEQPRKYCSHGDFLISKSTLLRLLVEVDFTSVKSWPTDLARLLLTGAFIVHREQIRAHVLPG